MGNSQTKVKLTKRERLKVLFKIDRTFDSFCHACPYFGFNTPHKNCRQCPIDERLRDYGKQLGWKEDPNKPKSHDRWSIEEDDYLLQAFGKVPIDKIAKKLGRSYASVYKRILRLREKGILTNG